MRFWVVLFLLLGSLLGGCANKDHKCGNKFLALWPNDQGTYSFQEIKLHTLTNPYEMKGSVAHIFYESGIGSNGFRGSVAQPRFTRTGDTCVPMDTPSSAAVSLYAQFEELKRFDDKIGVAHYLTWPRKVGLDIHLVSANGKRHNNAHYFGSGDGIAVIPYNLKALPMAENHGIMAHEHFHAYFHARVNIPLNTSLSSNFFDLESYFYPSVKATVEDIESADLSSVRGLNGIVLRAWNEGLADLYGAIKTGNPRFVNDSVEDGTRSLDNKLMAFTDRYELTSLANRLRMQGRSKALVDFAYVQGALLGRLMYRVAMSGAEPPEVFLKRVIDRLSDITPAIAPSYNSQVLNFEDVVPILLKEFRLKAKTCLELQSVLSAGMVQCTGV